MDCEYKMKCLRLLIIAGNAEKKSKEKCTERMCKENDENKKMCKVENVKKVGIRKCIGRK